MPLNGVEVLETVRDCAQSPDVEIKSVEDALSIINIMDTLGYADIIEAGFAGAHPIYDTITREATQMGLSAKVATFGRLRAPNTSVDDFSRNPFIKYILDLNTPVVVLVYKSWDYQVPTVGATLDENLKMLEDTVRFFVKHGKEVIADAEFATGAFLGKIQKGVEPNLEYLLYSMRIAKEAGARKIVLCDTEGKILPPNVGPLVNAAITALGDRKYVGFHGHDDHDVGSANNYLAIMSGVSHVQTTFLGHGERTGNVSSINMLGLLTSPYQSNPLKFDMTRFKEAAEVIHLLLTGRRLPSDTPFVGNNAFTHKGGMHGDGNLKLDDAYNARDPAEFGNKEIYPITDQGGTAHVALALGLDKRDQVVRKVYEAAMGLVDEGYKLEQYPAFLKLLAARAREGYQPPFKIIEDALDESSHDGTVSDYARFKVDVNGQLYKIKKAQGAGPVDAIIKPLETILRRHFSLPTFDFRFETDTIRGKKSSQVVLGEASFIVPNGDIPKVYTMPGISSSITQAGIKAITAGLEYMILQGKH